MKKVVAALAVILGLVLAYLGVASQEHWFPLEPKYDTQSINFNDPEIRNQAREVFELENFLIGHKGKVVQLKLSMQVFSQEDGLLVKTSPEAEGAIDSLLFYISCTRTMSPGECPHSLTLIFAKGPGSQLGYAEHSTPASAYVDGYFQVGEILTFNAITQVTLIPVQKP